MPEIGNPASRTRAFPPEADRLRHGIKVFKGSGFPIEDFGNDGEGGMLARRIVVGGRDLCVRPKTRFLSA